MLLFISAAKLYVIWPTIHLYLFGDNKSISEVSPDCVLYVRLLNLSRSTVHVSLKKTCSDLLHALLIYYILKYRLRR
jgi:hypothetical protein